MPESFDNGPTLARRICDDVKACPAKMDTGFAKKACANRGQKETANFDKLAVRRGLILRLGGPQK
jgi:hypothetical protein